ncbi:carboxymuconolactone decarboxylase family protein [Streptomyces sp. NA02950]|uniref:carboxymuconolactone decarboxylase family protein n=1 Tax=Streptomyces sp. NA02950 TaxID=2742137 RepID=UPI001590F638|nr:carboxymuconolactone decarboxylase family protein [Streptomyces sp. NA02950]QKV96991.1 carboxymuconolactone decarboxylase family protein [Streptomyces sp. NA02950]
MGIENESRITMARLSELPSGTREVIDSACERTGARHVFLTLARHPQLAVRYVRFGLELLGDGVMDDRQRELVILRVAWLCRSDYEWGHHVRLGKRCGLRARDISRIPQGPGHPGWSAEDAAMLTAVDELVHRRCVSPDTWHLLARGWDEKKLIEFLVLVGHYVTLAGLLNSIDIAREPGVEGFQAPAGKATEEPNEAGSWPTPFR